MTRSSAGATWTTPRWDLRSETDGTGPPGSEPGGRVPFQALIGTAASGVATWKLKLSSR